VSEPSPKNWKATAVSIPGPPHLVAGVPCQDYSRVLVKDQLVLLAVADGHGSVSMSDHGSRFAVEAVFSLFLEVAAGHMERAEADRPPGTLQRELEQASRQVGPRLVHDWIQRVREHVGREDGAPTAEVDTKEYGSTLVCCLILDDFALCLQIGDGDFLTLDRSGGVKRIFEGDAELFATETRSLCNREAAKFVQTRVIPLGADRPVLFLLSTDGLSDSFPEKDSDFFSIPLFWEESIQKNGWPSFTGTLVEFLAQASDKGSQDDMSVAVLHWPAELLQEKVVAASQTAEAPDSKQASVEGSKVSEEPEAKNEPGRSVATPDAENRERPADTKGT
jgi:serine/threonine protein phosphatase PrpC